MAKPLKQTPILTGKDAVNFFELQKAVKNNKATAFSVAHIASTNVVPGKPAQFSGGNGGD
jgi:hypothetical protein